MVTERAVYSKRRKRRDKDSRVGEGTQECRACGILYIYCSLVDNEQGKRMGIDVRLFMKVGLSRRACKFRDSRLDDGSKSGRSIIKWKRRGSITFWID